MELGQRMEIFIPGVIATAILVPTLGLPGWVVSLVVAGGVSFLVSGLIYGVVHSLGLGFVSKLQIGAVSGMTVTVVVFKQLLIA